MIVMNLELDNIYGFNGFKINFSYPKKIVKTTIENEFLMSCPNFRYKKAVVLMGSNATGKTTLGRALLRIFTFLETGNPSYLIQMISDKERKARISIDYVNADRILHRVVFTSGVDSIAGSVPQIDVRHECARIQKNDTYESASRRLLEVKEPEHSFGVSHSLSGPMQYYFALDTEDKKYRTSSVDSKLFIKVLKAVIGTLDPSSTDIAVIKDIEDSYVIRRNGQEIILQKGEITNRHLLSSGTQRGIDIAILMANIIANKNGFYYCDEHFSYIQTDLEKRMFGIMLENLQDNEQLIFTTHNSDMLELNIPKHSFAFLRKEKDGDYFNVSVMYASDVLKRNTDSIRCAAANDVFSSIPDETLLDSLEQ